MRAKRRRRSPPRRSERRGRHETITSPSPSFRANAARPRSGADTYDPAQEHDACGVGCVAALDGKPRRDVVQAGIDALKAVWHRGAVDADGKTGDGAGIHVEIPQDFFADACRSAAATSSQRGRIAVGMVFLPHTDLGAQERCRTIVETEILSFGYAILRLAPGADRHLRASARRPTRRGPRSSRS